MESKVNRFEITLTKVKHFIHQTCYISYQFYRIQLFEHILASVNNQYYRSQQINHFFLLLLPIHFKKIIILSPSEWTPILFSITIYIQLNLDYLRLIIITMLKNNKAKTLTSDNIDQQTKFKIKSSMSLKKLNTQVAEKLAQGYKYDKTLFHKTIFHLRPLDDNPELFTREISLSSHALSTLKFQKTNNTKAVIPHPVTVKIGLQRLEGKSKMLKDQTLTHVTAKKWLIYNMKQGFIVKGYKYRQLHDVASLSKLLTFYTAYDIIQEYYLVTNTFQIMVLPADHKVGGTMLRMNQSEDILMSLQDALYALLLVSANNIATAIANNLGSYLVRQNQTRYFSCFDLPFENREINIANFIARMKKLAKEIGLKDTSILNPHGSQGNMSTALDMACLAAECFKIPLFSKISTMKKVSIKTKEINEEGQMVQKSYLLENSNKILGRGCLGGKTGSSIGGGESFLGAFPGSMAIVVLGSAGKEQRFHDCLRLAEWVNNKLFFAQKSQF